MKIIIKPKTSTTKYISIIEWTKNVGYKYFLVFTILKKNANEIRFVSNFREFNRYILLIVS